MGLEQGLSEDFSPLNIFGVCVRHGFARKITMLEMS